MAEFNKLTNEQIGFLYDFIEKTKVYNATHKNDFMTDYFTKFQKLGVSTADYNILVDALSQYKTIEEIDFEKVNNELKNKAVSNELYSALLSMNRQLTEEIKPNDMLADNVMYKNVESTRKLDEHLSNLKKAGGFFGNFGVFRNVINSVERYRNAILEGKNSKTHPEFAMDVVDKINQCHEYGKVNNGKASLKHTAIVKLKLFMEEVADQHPESDIRKLQGRDHMQLSLTDIQMNKLKNLFQKINEYDARIERRRESGGFYYRNAKTFEEANKDLFKDLGIDEYTYSVLKGYYKNQHSEADKKYLINENASGFELIGTSVKETQRTFLNAIGAGRQEYEKLAMLNNLIDDAIEKDEAEFPRLQLNDAVMADGNNLQDEFGEFVNDDIQSQRESSLDDVIKTLNNAKTFSNSKQYKRLIESVVKLNERMKSGNGPDPLLANDVMDNIQTYFEHKGRHGVKATAESKLEAVEGLYQYMTGLSDKYEHVGVRKPGLDIPDRTAQEESALKISGRPISTRSNYNLDAAYKRISIAAREGLNQNRITNEQYNGAKASVDMRHEKLLTFAKNSVYKRNSISEVINKISKLPNNYWSHETNMIIAHGNRIADIYKNALANEKSASEIKSEINFSIAAIRQNLAAAKNFHRENNIAVNAFYNLEKFLEKENPLRQKINVNELSQDERPIRRTNSISAFEKRLNIERAV